MIEAYILSILPSFTGYCLGAFSVGYGIAYLFKFYRQITEKV